MFVVPIVYWEETPATNLSSHHCECFPRAGLPIGKHTGIVSFKRCLQDCLPQIIEHLRDINSCSPARVTTTFLLSATRYAFQN